MSGPRATRAFTGAGRRRRPPRYRLARPDDLGAAARVWSEALSDYLGRLNQPTFTPDLAPIRRLFAHLLSTDPARFWVATRHPDARPAPGDAGADGERVVGFASATVRGDVWFLGMLFVDPAEQGEGIGAALLERVVDGTEGCALATATDSAQPISNAMYARLGIVPRLPVLHLTGRVERPDAIPPLGPDVEPVPFPQLDPGEVAASVDAIDRRLLGIARRGDHEWLPDDGREGVLFRRGAQAVGYGYLTGVGRIGPVAALDAADVAGFIGHLLAVRPPPGAHSVWVPGAAGAAVQALLGAGFWLEPFPAMLCWTRPFAPFERYLPISLALV